MNLDQPAAERLVAKIWRALEAQEPSIRAALEDLIRSGDVIRISDLPDGRILVAVEAPDGTHLPLCDATLAELRAGVH